MANNRPKSFTHQLVNDGSHLLLELTNTTKETLKCVEILTVFLKTQDLPDEGLSQVHIRFEALERILPAEKSIMPHTVWINGKKATNSEYLRTLQVVDGKAHPYVLDISWEDREGKTRFQRIPVGH